MELVQLSVILALVHRDMFFVPETVLLYVDISLVQVPLDHQLTASMCSLIYHCYN